MLRTIITKARFNVSSLPTKQFRVQSISNQARSVTKSLEWKAMPMMSMVSMNRMDYRSLSTSSANSGEKMEFKAETRKLLDIVTNSIYTDKEVFMRELISNASDALEKYRYKKVLGEVTQTDAPLEINILVDKEKKTISITDNGIGMTREELVANLGTIARSGSKQFVESLNNNATPEAAEAAATGGDKHGIIGQFGVGFYSAFMTSESVSVESISASESGPSAHKWFSDGSGEFYVDKVEPHSDEFKHGTRVTMSLKDSCIEFADVKKLKDIIKRYSNFVSFPIKLNGEAVNTVTALWAEDKSKVTPLQYKEFYRFIANAYDEPKYTLHFRTDAPIDLKVLLFVPGFHSEKFGQARMEPGVNLYSRKVLIESKPKDLLPDWLRFVRGVVDSEDLPLSLSREKPQDSNLIRRIREVLTRKLIRHFDDQAKEHPADYKEFYLEYGYFLKEGACHDVKFVDQISKLLLFESSAKADGELISFDDYISRSAPEQKEIFYIVAPSRSAALASPYYETFAKHKQEVLFLYNAVDDFVMGNIRTYGGRPLVSAETSSVDLDARYKKDGEEKKDESEGEKEGDKPKKDESTAAGLSEAQVQDLCAWFKLNLGETRVREVKTTSRLSGSPAIVTDHESGALRRMMRMVEQSKTGETSSLPPQVLEINPKHPIIVSLFDGIGSTDEASTRMTKLVAEQVFDNALIAAGLIDDPRSMLSRLNDILLAASKK